MIIKRAESDWELEGILKLQDRNLEKSISGTELKQEGFVTVRHNQELLKRMNDALPSIIAVDQEQVVGYTLSMTKDFRNDIPILVPMFELIDSLSFKTHKLSRLEYLVGGQVCIEKTYRGQGLFNKLYGHARKIYAPQYPVMMTEVSDRNPRSVTAHLNCGFVNIHNYRMDEKELWSILAWNWSL